MDEVQETSGQEMTRREALGLFKAVAVLGAGLAITRNSLGQYGQGNPYNRGKPSSPTGSTQIKLMPGEGNGFYCRFYVNSANQGKQTPEQVFSVQLPGDMVAMLSNDPHSNVQVKFFMFQDKWKGAGFGDGSVRLNQGMIQSKDFSNQIKGSIQVKLAPTP